MTARHAILPPPPEPVDDRATDPDLPPSGCRVTIRPVPPLDEAARANDGAAFVFPCGCTVFEDCEECAPELWSNGRRIEEP